MSGGDDAAVRDLWRQIAQEKDPEKVHQLLVALRIALKEEQEEARLRMGQIARHYGRRISEPERESPGTEPLVFADCAAHSRPDQGFGWVGIPTSRRPEGLISHL